MAITQEEFDTAVDAIDVRNIGPEQAMRQIAERFPHVTGGEFMDLMERFLARENARLARLDERIRGAKAVVAALDGEPRSASVGDAVRRRAAAGDPAAQAIAAQFESPRFRLDEALFAAAVSVHPDWHALDDGSVRHRPPKDAPKVDPLEAPDKLVDWYLDTYPAEASAIAERITGEKQPEVRL